MNLKVFLPSFNIVQISKAPWFELSWQISITERGVIQCAIRYWNTLQKAIGTYFCKSLNPNVVFYSFPYKKYMKVLTKYSVFWKYPYIYVLWKNIVMSDNINQNQNLIPILCKDYANRHWCGNEIICDSITMIKQNQFDHDSWNEIIHTFNL